MNSILDLIAREINSLLQIFSQTEQLVTFLFGCIGTNSIIIRSRLENVITFINQIERVSYSFKLHVDNIYC